MARVIRGSGGTVMPAEVFDARREAERILSEARTQAARIVAEAETQRAGIGEDARREGRERGLAEAAALLARAAAVRDGALAGAEQELGALAMGIARRIIGEELATAPERIVPIVREVLARARRARDVVVMVHPDDAATLSALPRDALGVAFDLEEDPSLHRGGCVVRTELGRLDASIEVQLEALARALDPLR